MYSRGYPMMDYDPRRRDDYPMYAQKSGMRNPSNGGGGNRGAIRRYDDGQMSYAMYMDDPGYRPMHHEPMMRDPREGRSGERRLMYMEGKGYKDKIKQMQELESYMQELANDITEMVQDASPEEKQLLQTKIATLAAKIK